MRNLTTEWENIANGTYNLHELKLLVSLSRIISPEPKFPKRLK